MIDRGKVIKGLESLRDICNAKSNMAIGNGKVAWAGYANTADDAIALLKEKDAKTQGADMGMTDTAYIVSRMLEDKIAIAENNGQNTLLVTLDVLKEITTLLKEQLEMERIEKLKEYICGEMPKRDGDRWTFLQKERELVRCKDCEHRPTKPDDYQEFISDEGFRLEFHDNICPAGVEDRYYAWYPSDNFFCGYGKRKET